MFGFKNRKRYNGSVDVKLNEEYRIATRDNPKFPGILAYLKIIDQAWTDRFTEEEAAMFIATLYYSGLRREGHDAEADALAAHLSHTGQADFGSGKISAQRFSAFIAAVERADAVEDQPRKRPDNSPVKSLPKAQPRPDGLTPCLTPGCTNAPLRLPVTSVFAQVEYQLRRNPRAVVKLHCPQCRRESAYGYGTLFELLPEKLRPTPLPEGVVFAVLLAELDTSTSMPRSFFGERILTRVINQSEGWRGRTLGRSQFCPRTLPPGTEIAGTVVREHFVIEARRSGPTDVPIDVKEVPKNSCFAILISPRNDPSVLLSANPFCPNPSCMNVCSLTFTQFENAIAQGAAQSRDPDADPHIVWECNICHATMMVGVDTFNDLYKI